MYVLDRINDFRGVNYQLVELPIENSEESYWYSQFHTHSKGLLASPLLFETDTSTQLRIEKSLFLSEECLSFNAISDPLASIFFLLTRMEEYNYSNYDHHDRFQTKDSVLSTYGWLQKLVVERWIDVFLLDYQQKMNVQIVAQKSTLRFTLTVDIDNTFAFKWKPFPRIIGSYFKDVLHGDWQRITAKTATLFRFKKDPYDTFDLIYSYQKQGVDVILFWLLGDLSRFDRNVSNRSRRHLKWIEKQSKRLTLGIHPSYQSNLHFEQLEKEKNILENTIHQKVSFSRQHFLKLKFPETYQRNQKVGLDEDFTMGFGDQIGFRAGTLRPFPFFDLSKNQSTNYRIHPFAYMDGTFSDYLKFSPDESMKTIQKLIDEASQYGGNFIAIWHNESLSEWHQWKGWKSVLDFTIRAIHEVTN